MAGEHIGHDQYPFDDRREPTGLERDLAASLRWALAYIEKDELIKSERPRYDVAKAVLKRADR